MHLATSATLPFWIGFAVIVLVMLVLDLGVFHRKAHAVRFKEALLWSCIWIGVSLAFCVGVYLYFGAQAGLEFFTGYLIEKSLSVDNIFVFVVMFTFFRVKPEYQHRILYWGILGALLMRGVMIAAGAALIRAFHPVIILFGLFLVYTGSKLIWGGGEDEVHPEKSRILRLFRRFVPTARGEYGIRFFVREEGRVKATHYLMVLALLETTDLLFAVDSIPAIFAITEDIFIVYTSNIFAILGLRSMYFLMAGVVDKFRYLKMGLALVLIFVGVKMAVSVWIKIPIGLSLAVVAVLLVGSVVLSLVIKETHPVPKPEDPKA